MLGVGNDRGLREGRCVLGGDNKGLGTVVFL